MQLAKVGIYVRETLLKEPLSMMQDECRSPIDAVK